MIHGNISSKGIYKVKTWNKGNSSYHNKVDDIHLTSSDFPPDFSSICEATYDVNYNKIFSGYIIEAKRLHISNNVARYILIINDKLAMLDAMILKINMFFSLDKNQN